MLYKLTRADGTTGGGDYPVMQWGKGVTNTVVRRENPRLCTGDVVHAYIDPLQAAFFDCIHGGYGPDALLWTCDDSEVVVSDSTKSGVFELTTRGQIPLPQLSTEQRVGVAIRVVLRHCEVSDDWRTWAENWLSGADRSGKSAWAAAWAESAAASAERAAKWAAEAEGAERAATWAAEAARSAAAWAVDGRDADIIALLHEVCDRRTGGK